MSDGVKVSPEEVLRSGGGGGDVRLGTFLQNAGRIRKCCSPISTWTRAWWASLPRPSRCTRYWTLSTISTASISTTGKLWCRMAFPASRLSPRLSLSLPNSRSKTSRYGMCSVSPARITIGRWLLREVVSLKHTQFRIALSFSLSLFLFSVSNQIELSIG